jgi:hypothetical protein
MGKYDCIPCGFTSKNKTDYTRHCLSIKHKYNAISDDLVPPKNHRKPTDKRAVGNDIYSCEFCGSKYTRLDSLKRHQTKCSFWKLSEKEKIIKIKEKIIKDKNKMLTSKDKTIQNKEKAIRKQTRDHKKEILKYQEELHYFKQILKLSEEKGNANVSAFSYISNNYTNADPLEKITYEKFIENSEIQYTDPDSDKSYNDKLIEDMIYSHRHNMLDKYLGDTIISIYRSDNPDRQSIWSTDQARLKYVIRQCVDGEMVRWVADCKGVNTTKMIIEPLSQQLQDALFAYQNRYCIAQNNQKYTYEQQQNMMRDNLSIMEIRRDIDNKKLHNSLLKYMAPFFSTDKLHIKNKDKKKSLFLKENGKENGKKKGKKKGKYKNTD